MAFSTAVKIGDLNDFIAPSQACVVALQPQKAPAPAADTQPVVKEGLQLNVRSSKRSAAAAAASAHGAGATAATTESSPPSSQAPATPQQQQQQQQQPKAPSGFQQTVVHEESRAVKVSLNDCLACSGCVTSAETVLLQHQSLGEFMARCGDPDVRVVVSVSPQSRASLAALHGLSAADVQGRLANALKSALCVALLLDTGLGAALALTEAAAEFVARYRQHHAQPATGGGSASNGSQPAAAVDAGPLPLLASSCPGWVCYAEKTHGRHVLPHIASSRSPQAVMGALVKQVLARQRGWDPATIYHVTVMPCYDKKLEASRDDFLVPGTSVPQVDCCLTTGELQELLDKAGCGALAALPAGRPDNLLQLLQQGWQQQQQQGCQEAGGRWPEPLLHVQPGSSGGYATHIFAAASKALFGVALPPGQPLPWKARRNPDSRELVLLAPDGSPLLRFGVAYGFRNIQTVVRQIKGGRGEADYVEVMACPSGCLNGGGQIKPQQQQQGSGSRAGQSQAQLLEQLELLFAAQQGGSGCEAGASSGCCGRGECSGKQAAPEQQQQCGGCGGGSAAFRFAPGVVQLLHPPVPPAADGGSSWQSWAVPQCADPAALAAVYERLLGAAAGPGNGAAAELLHTAYHQRERSVAATISDW